MSEKPLSFEAWQESVHACIKNDPLWTLRVNQKALFLYDLTWHDCEHLLRDPRGRTLAGQLVRSVGGIAANIEEGYGRTSDGDNQYHLRIALGEAREARGWYWRGRDLLPPLVVDHRLGQLTDIIAALSSLTRQSRPSKKA